MISIWKVFGARRAASVDARAELIARGEQFQVSLGSDVFVGSCWLSGYRDEWSKLILMSDTIRQTVPVDSPPLAPERREAIAAEAVRLLQAKAYKTAVSAYSESASGR